MLLATFHFLIFIYLAGSRSLVEFIKHKNKKHFVFSIFYRYINAANREPSSEHYPRDHKEIGHDIKQHLTKNDFPQHVFKLKSQQNLSKYIYIFNTCTTIISTSHELRLLQQLRNKSSTQNYENITIIFSTILQYIELM